MQKSELDEIRSLREAVYITIHRDPIHKLNAIAEELDMAPSYLARAALPDKETDGAEATGCRFPLKKIIGLCRFTKNNLIVDYIERCLGRVAFNLPPADASIKDINRQAIKAAKEFGELMAEVDRSIDDQQITKGQADRLTKEGYDAIQAILNCIETAKVAARK